MKKVSCIVPDGIPVSLTVKLCQSSSISGFRHIETDIRKNINNLVFTNEIG
jgi:hypothetical protein